MNKTLILLIAALFASGTAFGQDSVTIGGFTERFGADEDGDNTPPVCDISIPSFAASPFQVLWDCQDNREPRTNLRSEVWIRRNGEQVDSLVTNFLGFPAGIDVSAGLLGVAEGAAFETGLPAGFRLVVRDRAGNAAISELLVVQPGVQPVSTCDVDLVVNGESNGEVVATTTTASIDGARVNVVSSTVSGSGSASPCEVESICAEDSEIGFVVNFTASGSGEVDSATISLENGEVESDLTGTVTLDGSTATALSLSGETTVNETAATVTVSCEQ